MTAARTDRRDWLSLGEASRLLGVSAATLRRWSDSGRLRPFTTPGGHRRFAREALERLLPSDRGRRPPLAGADLTEGRIRRAYRRESRVTTRELPWLTTLDDAERSGFRDLGRRLAWSLVAHLDATEPEARAHQLVEATALAAEYGRRGAALGGSMSDVVEGFLAFRRPFLAEIGSAAGRRGFDAGEVVGLHADAERAMDRLLVATMNGHTNAAVALVAGPAAAASSSAAPRPAGPGDRTG
jgi:excisionase family DNA binding protein